MSRYCPNCAQPIEGQIERGPDGDTWCPNCRTKIKGKLQSVPAWTLGVLTLLLAIWQFGLL
jgi:hypothetical protein